MPVRYFHQLEYRIVVGVGVRDIVDLPQDCHSLVRQRHTVGALGFHSGGWNLPHGVFKVYLRPYHPAYLRRSRRRQNQKFKRQPGHSQGIPKLNLADCRPYFTVGQRPVMLRYVLDFLHQFAQGIVGGIINPVIMRPRPPENLSQRLPNLARRFVILGP